MTTLNNPNDDRREPRSQGRSNNYAEHARQHAERLYHALTFADELDALGYASQLAALQEMGFARDVSNAVNEFYGSSDESILSAAFSVSSDSRMVKTLLDLGANPNLAGNLRGLTSFLHSVVSLPDSDLNPKKRKFIDEVINSGLANSCTFHPSGDYPLTLALLRGNLDLASKMARANAPGRALTRAEAGTLFVSLTELPSKASTQSEHRVLSQLIDIYGDCLPPIRSYIAKPLTRIVAEAIRKEISEGLFRDNKNLLIAHISIAICLGFTSKMLAEAMTPVKALQDELASLFASNEQPSNWKKTFDLAFLAPKKKDFDPTERRYKVYSENGGLGIANDEQLNFYELFEEVLTLERDPRIPIEKNEEILDIYMQTGSIYAYYLHLKAFLDVRDAYDEQDIYAPHQSSGVHLTQLLPYLVYRSAGDVVSLSAGRILRPILQEIDDVAYTKDYHPSQAELLVILNTHLVDSHVAKCILDFKSRQGSDREPLDSELLQDQATQLTDSESQADIDLAKLIQALTAPKDFQGKRVKKLFRPVQRPWGRIGVQNFNFLPQKYPAMRVFPAREPGLPNECLLERMGWTRLHPEEDFKKEFGPAFAWTVPSGGLQVPGLKRNQVIYLEPGTYFEVSRGAKLVRLPDGEAFMLFNKSHIFGRDIRPYSAAYCTHRTNYPISVAELQNLSEWQYEASFRNVFDPELYQANQSDGSKDTEDSELSKSSSNKMGRRLTYFLDQLWAMELYYSSRIFDTRRETAYQDFGDLGGKQFLGGKESPDFVHFVEMVRYVWEERKAGRLDKMQALAFLPRPPIHYLKGKDDEGKSIRLPLTAPLPPWRPIAFNHRGRKLRKLPLSDLVVETLVAYAGHVTNTRLLKAFRETGLQSFIDAGVHAEAELVLTDMRTSF